MIYPSNCCEDQPGCCPDTAYEIRVFLNKTGLREQRYYRKFEDPVSFETRIPGNVFKECGLYEIEGTLIHCGNVVKRTISRFVDEREAEFHIASLSDTCCECVETGTLIQLKAVGSFTPVENVGRTGRWLLYCNDVLIRDTGFTPDYHRPFNFKAEEIGVYKVIFEYKNYCGTIRKTEKTLEIFSPVFFKRLGCDKFLVVKPCSKNPYDKAYEVWQYKNYEKVLRYKIDENVRKELTMGPGIYQIRYFTAPDETEKKFLLNLCPLDECMEQILDMFLCTKKCDDLRKEIDAYYNQISFLWNYLTRLTTDLEFCDDEDEKYFVIAELIDNLSKLCEDCFTFNNRYDCGCGKNKSVAKRTLKQ